jgi:molybdenum cofactor biosynthesis enzyme MoaA
MSRERAEDVIRYCHRLGAEYLTFVGGEPTLHPDLPELILEAGRAGYQKVMVDTNGLSVKPLLSLPPNSLYYARVSLDGASSSTHDKVRGPGTFTRTKEGIRTLVAAGHQVRITYTLFNFNCHELPALLDLAQDLGIRTVNLHSFSEEGYGCANTDWAITPKAWTELWATITELASGFDGTLRYPPTWVKPEDLKVFTGRGYQGCLGCSLDRLSIFPDGRCYVCSMLFDTDLNFGYITEDGLRLNPGPNEYEMFTAATLASDAPELSGCPAEKRLRTEPGGDFVSVCRLWRTEG